ncbi:MAG: helix-turn-helix transcriptional regulator [Firmicutes bacterium]|nr:helix-turn-helix transcriptional regulator [Bacillota bacterium]
MTLTQAVKQRLKEILENRDMSLYKLERLGFISPNTARALMSERNASVNLKTVMQIIRALEMRASEFFDSPLFDSHDLNID